MDLTFERGDAQRPSGHALMYFTTSAPERVLATYMIILPIAFSPAKYIPPMFAASLPGMEAEVTRPVSLPIIPEEVESHDHLARLAEARGDDLVFAGSVLDDEPQRLMLEVGYAAEAYSAMYEQYLATVAPSASPVAELDPSTVLYSAMSEGERLAELTKLTGALRDATERGDLRGTAENTRSMRALLENLSPKYRGQQLAAAAQMPGDRGRRLCELLLERAYALYREEYHELGRLDREIEGLESQERA